MAVVSPRLRQRSPRRPLNVLLLVVDSLRAQTLRDRELRIPFLRGLERETICFRRAYATECWTLPAHASMFTGQLPSQHGAHFQTMTYAQAAPTIAEVLSAAGLHTEVVTRNSIFDGTIPGITRGFRANTQLLSQRSTLDPLSLLLAASKPRFRRQIQTSGFFHPLQRASRRFAVTFARATLPADRRVLEHTLDRIALLRRQQRRYFIFCNLYDVHAPYPPTETSILRPFWSLQGLAENMTMPFVLPCLGGHTYLRPGFRLAETSRRMLLGRYRRAIELMDGKLRDFFTTARDQGVLDDTLVILTSDHGEAFGEHGLYLHDASVYDTHLHVPLWIHDPDRPPAMVDDVVSMRDLFGLMLAAATGRRTTDTILGADYRASRPIAFAEHFHYPHCQDADPRYRQNLLAAVAGGKKVVVRREGVFHYDLERDPAEAMPAETDLDSFEASLRRDGFPRPAVKAAVDRLWRWQAGPAVGERSPAVA